MADALTTNYEFIKVEVGGSDNTWGGKLNGNMDLLDTNLFAIDFRNASNKANPVNGDKVPILDSENSNAKATVTFQTIASFIFSQPSFLDSVFEVKDNSDQTKKIKFEVSGIAASTTRTFSWPNANGEVLVSSAEQTVSNKTILLKAGVSESPTADGDIRWDSDDNFIVVGDGAATRRFPPLPTDAVAGDLLTVGADAKSLVRIAKGTAGQSLVMKPDASAAEFGVVRPLLHIRDQKTSGTAGGAATSGSWFVRTLNTKVTDEIDSTLGSNQFSLPAGTYEIDAIVPGFRVAQMKAKLYNVTDANDTILGSSVYLDDNVSFGNSHVRGRFTISATKTFNIQMRVGSSRSNDGLGPAASFGTEIYTDVMIYKVG